MTSRFRKKRYALLVLVLGLYGLFFSGIVFGYERDDVRASTRAEDARAEDISCSRNWVVLGATWSCRATVVTPDGQRVPYAGFASALTPADIGHDVAMSEIRVKGHGSQFVPTRDRPRATAMLLLSLVLFGSAVVLGPIVLWPRKPFQAPAPLRAAEKVGEARKLRRRAGVLLGVGVVVLYGSYTTFGFLVPATANTDHAVHQEVKGTGVPSSCTRDWTHLGLLWSCDVTITLANPGVTILSPTRSSPFTSTVHYSQFAPEDIDRPVPMTASPTMNPFGHGYVWAVAEQPREPGFAKVTVILLLMAGLVVLGGAQFDWRRARRYEREASSDGAALNT